MTLKSSLADQTEVKRIDALADRSTDSFNLTFHLTLNIQCGIECSIGIVLTIDDGSVMMSKIDQMKKSFFIDLELIKEE